MYRSFSLTPDIQHVNWKFKKTMTMNISAKNKAHWKKLYETIEKFQETKPWEFFEDNYIFGIQDPATGIFGWSTIMGAAQEVFGLHIFLGDEGFQNFRDIAENFGINESDNINLAFSQRSISVSFVSEQESEDEDLAILKKIGYKPKKGKNKYFRIRDFTPGMIPWYIDTHQAIFLTHCVEQVLALVESIKKGEAKATHYEEELLLVMLPEDKDGELTWQFSYIEPPQPPAKKTYPADPFLTNRLRKELDVSDFQLLFSFQYFLAPIQEKKDERPVMPRLGLWINEYSGRILDTKLFGPEDPWQSIQKKFNEIFLELDYIPETIIVDSDAGMSMLKNFTKKLRIGLEYDPSHPVFDDVKGLMNEIIR